MILIGPTSSGAGPAGARNFELRTSLKAGFLLMALKPIHASSTVRSEHWTLWRRPKRLVYLSSGLHQQGDASLKDLAWVERPWRGLQAYSDNKLHDVLLAFAIAPRWPDVLSNALEPGWVPTKMGGPRAPDDLDAGHRTQVWLVASDDPAAMVNGEYFHHMRRRNPNQASRDVERQEKLLEACKHYSGVDLATA